MAGSVNKVILVGNLGKDPEVRTTQDGSKIVNLTLATSETWNDRAVRRAQGTHRVAPGGDLQRPGRRRGRALSEEGRQDLRRGIAADAQMDRPVGPGALHHRGGDRPLQRSADHAGYRAAAAKAAGGRGRRLSRDAHRRSAAPAGGARAAAAARPGMRRRAATWTTKFRSDFCARGRTGSHDRISAGTLACWFTAANEVADPSSNRPI